MYNEVTTPPYTRKERFFMKYDHISFVNYNMNQLVLPLDLEILIPQNHLSTIVHEAEKS